MMRFFLLFLVAAGMARGQTLLFNGSFESGRLTGYYPDGNNAEISTLHRRSGRAGMKAHLDRDRSASEYRTEVTVRASDGTAWNDPVRLPFRFDFHRPYWIALSIFLPSDYGADYRGMSEVLFQVHNSPDDGEGYTNPMLAIETDGPRWKIYSRWSDDVPTRKNVWDEVRVIDGGDMTRDRGTWVDWVVHAEFSWASSGFLAVYKNQVLVDSISGPTSTQDAQGPYVKFGIYKWPWMEPVPSDYRFNTSRRTVYFDEFKIGDSLNTLRSMSP